MEDTKDLQAELAYQARQAAAQSLRATPRATLEEYRDCRRWRSHRKQYTFSLVHKSKPVKVLDFGCGSGDSSTELAFCGYEVTGLDVSPDLLELARKRAELDGVAERCQFVLADGGQAPFPDNTFDMILVQAVLHHVNMAECLAQLRRILKPGGHLVIVEPVAFSRWLQKLRDITPVEKDISPNERQLGLADLREIANFFEVLETRYFHITTRLNRLFSNQSVLGRAALASLARLDWLLLKLPGVSHFAGTVVLRCRKPAGPS
jgi:ubiquinone/menaquinone biosynthesis C-methylase UbiE